MQNISQETIRNLIIPLPSISEQRAIIAFLDGETARINALVARKERLIELLQEKHTAFISRAVTKGLNPTVTMKHSGVGWLGPVPEHWTIRRLKHVAKLESGHTPSRQHPEYWENCTIPWVSLADVAKFRNDSIEYIEETVEKVSELGLANSSARLLPANTVILSRTASVGFSCILAQPMATTQDFADWICGPSLQPEYLLYALRSMKQEFRRLTMGSTHPTIYMPDIERLVVPVPPIDEQDAIVRAVRTTSSRLAMLIAKVREHIEKLREYRAALISAAVTGKIDVREEIA